VLRFSRREVEADPLSATGGGAIDVAAFALRVASLVLHRPKLSRMIVLDEPMKFVSAEYREGIRSMLEQLAADLDLQVVMVTHDEAYATGKVIEI
jgi:ABC-type sulfate/molybdate transport systems ATPase subunit